MKYQNQDREEKWKRENILEEDTFISPHKYFPKV